MPARILIIGASLAGLRVLESIRSAGFDGEVVVCGAERHPPYNRPPLSKDVLLEDGDLESALTPLQFRLRPNLGETTFKLGMKAVSADLQKKEVGFSDGSTLAYDGLVIATGLRPRRLSQKGAENRRFILRDIEDAIALRPQLTEGTRVVVVGGGFIGCEVAASASKRGCHVTVIEPGLAPMQRAIGISLGKAMQSVHEHYGINFRTGVAVTDLISPSQAEDTIQVALSNGEIIKTDILVESIGSLPNVEWLGSNHLDLTDGVLCDNQMRVIGAENVVAVGDVARFPNLFADEVPRRIEHWCIPGATAKKAAETLVACLMDKPVNTAPFAPLPSFWSDQHHLRMQSYGSPALADRTEILEGNLEVATLTTTGAAIGYYRDARLIGVVTVAIPPDRLSAYREMVTSAAVR